MDPEHVSSSSSATSKASGTSSRINIYKIKRRQKFGAALNQDNSLVTAIDKRDVYINYTPQKQYVAQDIDKYIPNGYYYSDAIANKWSDDEIKAIIRSDRPDEVWHSIKISKQGQINTSHNKDSKGNSNTTGGSQLSLSSLMSSNATANANGTTNTNATANANDKPNLRSLLNNEIVTIRIENIPVEYEKSDIYDEFKKLGFKPRKVIVGKIFYTEYNEKAGRIDEKYSYVDVSNKQEAEALILLLNSKVWQHSILRVSLRK